MVRLCIFIVFNGGWLALWIDWQITWAWELTESRLSFNNGKWTSLSSLCQGKREVRSIQKQSTVKDNRPKDQNEWMLVRGLNYEKRGMRASSNFLSKTTVIFFCDISYPVNARESSKWAWFVYLTMCMVWERRRKNCRIRRFYEVSFEQKSWFMIRIIS